MILEHARDERQVAGEIGRRRGQAGLLAETLQQLRLIRHEGGLVGVARRQPAVVERKQHRIDVEHPLEARRIEVGGHRDPVGDRRLDAQLVEDRVEILRTRVASFFSCALLSDAEQRLVRRGPVRIARRQPQRQRAFGHRRRIDFLIVGEAGMGVVVEDLDARDLRQQPLIDRRGFRRDQRTRLRAGVRGGDRKRAKDRQRRSRARHFLSGCGVGSGLRGSIASRIAA